MECDAVREAEACGVLLCDGARRWRDVDRVGHSVRQIVQHREANRARARADVSKAQRLLASHRPQSVNGGLHEDLGVGARHEGVGGDLEGQPHEFLLAEDLRNGHAQDALFDHLSVSGELTGLQRLVEVHIEIDALLLEHVREQHFRVEARRFDALILEVLLRPLQDAADGPDLVVHSAFTFFNRSA